MIRNILTASFQELQAEAERISLLDEPDREEAILELLSELQDLTQEAAYEEDEGFDDDDLEFGTDEDIMDYEEAGYDYESSEDEDTLDPDTYEREDDSMELADDPWSV